MSLFGNLTKDNLEQAEDRLGGGGLFESGVYEGIVKLAYAGKSQSSDAQFVEVHIDIKGKEFKERFFVTNKNGENFYLDKQDSSKKNPLPGFTMVDDLAMITCEQSLAEVGNSVQEKTVALWDFEKRAEVPTQVPVLTAMLGKPVKVAILKQTVDKQKKNNAGVYENTGETRDENIADKFFHPTLNVTIVEAMKGLDTPVFMEKWIEKNEGTVRNRAKGSQGKSGAPGAANGTQKPKASLFGT